MNHSYPYYYENPYVTEIQCTVVSIVPYKKVYAIITDKTICYPEGGGQPGDRGWIGEAHIIDTQMDDQQRILHIVSKRPSCSESDKLSMRIDWEYRYSYMQQHTAQHLLSGLLFSLYNIGTLSVHFSADQFSIETDVSSIDPQNLQIVEKEANSIVSSAVSVTSEIVTQEEAQHRGLRRKIPVDHEVRLVSLGTHDTIACGGVHVSQTSEIEYILYAGQERIRGHVRLFWVVGDHAIGQIHAHRDIVRELSTLLSAEQGEIVSRVQELQDRLRETQYQLRSHLVSHTLALLSNSCSAAEEGNFPIIILEDSEGTYDYIPEALLEIDQVALCAVKKVDEKRLLWTIGLKGVEQASSLFSQIKKELLPIIEGKGGGKEPLWQGIGVQGAKTEQFLGTMREFLLEKLHDSSR